MNGFITESVAKIADGFGNAIKLIILFLLTNLVLLPVNYFFQPTGQIIYCVVLTVLAATLFFAFSKRLSDQKRVWRGMAAGLLLFQALFLAMQVSQIPLFNLIDLFAWLGVAAITLVLWKWLLPTEVRMGLLVLLSCWLGKLYFMGLPSITQKQSPLALGYVGLQYLVIAAGVLAILYIVYRSRTISGRAYAAIMIFNATLFLFRAL